MIRQILVDASLPIDLTSVTYVIVQDDDRGLIRTIPMKASQPKIQVDEIIETARKYNIDKIKIDLHGVGLGLFDLFISIVGEENTNRKTGEVLLNTYNKAERDLFVEAQKSAERLAESLIDAFKAYAEFAKKEGVNNDKVSQKTSSN